MCGLLGYLGDAPCDIEALTTLLSHRGPDGSGTVTLPVAGRTVRLGHTRLAILDLSPAGHQPMSSRDGRFCIVFNGEIYNHLDLRAELAGPFRGHSDTETLVEALAAWGFPDTVRRLNGIFAFAAVDRAEGKLYLARDPFGVKPLYVRQRPDGVGFASEARVLRAIAPLERDDDALAAFLTLRFVPSPRTLWRAVVRVPAGHALTIDVASGASELARYVVADGTRFLGTRADAEDAWVSVLEAAVRRQRLSDVPVGTLLSGGIDSAVIAAISARQGDHGPTFTVGFGGGDAACELDDAAATAAALGLPHTRVQVSPDDLWNALPRVIAAVEEPLGTTSILPMWHLVERARQDVKVVLTGQGSDEPWGGYRRYQAEVMRQAVRGKRAFAPIARLAGKLPWPEVLGRGLSTLGEIDEARRFVAAGALFVDAERRQLLGSPSDGDAVGDASRWLQWVGGETSADRMMRVDARMQLADDLLLYGDKISMAFGLEARVPMVDLEVMRFVESLPLAFRVGVGRTKIVHRAAAHRLLPPSIVNRPKKGFLVPFGEWCRAEWRERVHDVLLGPGAPYLDRLDRRGVERVWSAHQAGRDRSRQLFALLALATWWRT